MPTQLEGPHTRTWGLQGAFAEAQALFLHPQQEQVAELASMLAAHKMGVVAHFYMDPEVSLPTHGAQSIRAPAHQISAQFYFLIIKNVYRNMIQVFKKITHVHGHSGLHP